MKTPQRFLALAAHKSVVFLVVIEFVKLFFALILFGIIFYFIAAAFIKDFDTINQQWMVAYLCTAFFYFVLRHWIIEFFKPLLQKLVGYSVKQLPTYTLESDGIVLNLGKGFLEHYRNLKVKFSDLEDVKVFDRFEAMAFQKYVLGPDIQFVTQAVSDTIKYQRGKIERPKFFSYMSAVTGASTLYLQGDEILYFIGIQGDGEDILNAFRRV